uniref:Uncharacterized protein n=1 Tax=Strongyloides papillosus TaxID=174720 RepID=A0A0N5CI54_STREA
MFYLIYLSVINALSLIDLENKNHKNNLKFKHISNPLNPSSKSTSDDLLKRWYSQYPLEDDDTPVPGDPPVKGLTDVGIFHGVGVEYGVGSFAYQRNFGLGTGISGRSGGQLYGYGSNFFPNLPG